MKKILLIVVLVLAIVFVGKYIYDKNIVSAVSFEKSNTASVSVGKAQTLTVDKQQGLIYSATIKLTNTTNSASSTFSFLGMPVLFFKAANMNQYVVATGTVIRSATLTDEYGQNFPITGPVYVIGAGASKQYKVRVEYSNLRPGSYKASLGTPNTESWNGYFINNGPKQPLPTQQTGAVTVAASIPAKFSNASSTIFVAKNASGTPAGIGGNIFTLMNVGNNNLQTGVSAQIDLVHATSGVMLRSHLVTLATNPGQVYNARTTYPLQFSILFGPFDQIYNLVRGTPYKVILRNISVIDVYGVKTVIPLDAKGFSTNVVTYN